MNRFGQHRRSQPRLERTAYHQVNPAGEELLEELLQSHVVVECLPVEFDEEVKVAVLSGLAPGRGPEHGQAPDPEPANPLAVGGQPLQYLVTIEHHAHCSGFRSVRNRTPPPGT